VACFEQSGQGKLLQILLIILIISMRKRAKCSFCIFSAMVCNINHVGFPQGIFDGFPIDLLGSGGAGIWNVDIG